MRTLLALVFLSFVACTVQSRGARCEQNADCDTAAGDLCRRENNGSQACSGTSTCVCCPAVGTGGIAACGDTNVNADAGATPRPTEGRVRASRSTVTPRRGRLRAPR